MSLTLLWNGLDKPEGNAKEVGEQQDLKNICSIPWAELTVRKTKNLGLRHLLLRTRSAAKQ